jgi:hypothetical protein
MASSIVRSASTAARTSTPRQKEDGSANADTSSLSEYDPPVGEDLVLHTGEIIPLDDARACASALDQIREAESRLKEMKGAITNALVQSFSGWGGKTMHLDGFSIELKGGTEVIWDIEKLEELRELGLPEARFDQLVTTEITYKVNANVAKQIASVNEQYAEVIAAARVPNPRPQRVDVKPVRD